MSETHLTPEEIAALRETFRAQAVELLEAYGRYTLELENAAKPDESLKALQRVVHTLKGDSMSLELEELAELAHRLEDLLDYLRKGKEEPNRELIDLLLACGDGMSELLEGYCASPPTPAIDIGPLLRDIEEAVHSSGPAAAGLPFASDRARVYRLTVTFARACQTRSAGAFLVRQRLERLARILEMDPDPETEAIERARTWSLRVESEADAGALRRSARVPGIASRVRVSREEASSTDSPSSRRDEDPLPRAGAVSSSQAEQLRVEVGKIDRIMNLVGELVIGRSMLSRAISSLAGTNEETLVQLTAANHFLERNLSELQDAVLKIRMIPMDHIFRRFPRVVRDLARSSGKEVSLEIRGAATELDKGIADALGEPLLHLVRNAIDHGIETPEERRRKGKPPASRLVLAAYYEGSHVHVLIEDDGRGMDLEALRRRAVALGLLQPDEAADLSRDETLALIYQTGFTSREDVSTVSGRGIGMDVVRDTIESLKGTIEVDTELGRGTRFLIRLPLTLAILRAILVEAAGRSFAIPMVGVLEIVRLFSDEASSVLGNRVLHLRERVIPLVSLGEELGLGPCEAAGRRRVFVLLIGEAERRVGLVVDDLLGEHELVVKPVEDPLVQNPAIAGASILGDGRVVLILNLREMTDWKRRAHRRQEVPA